MKHTEKMQEMALLLSCLKSSSRAQGAARVAYETAGTRETREAYIRACDTARGYERELLELWS